MTLEKINWNISKRHWSLYNYIATIAASVLTVNITSSEISKLLDKFDTINISHYKREKCQQIQSSFFVQIQIVFELNSKTKAEIVWN